MATAASISARLILDKSDYDKGLGDAEKQASDFQSKMKAVGQTMTNVGGKMTAGLTVPIAGAFTMMVTSASDLNESTNAMSVVFEDASDTIKKFGEQSAETIGLAQSDWFQLAAVTGASMKNYGMSQQEAADMTIDLGERAADMASIFNTDVSDAMVAIQSLMRGETEPIRRYGVSINEAAVSAKALEMGLVDANGEVTAAGKAQARLALFFEQTDQFAGDFANTSDQLANSTRILKAQLKDEAAALGTDLLPYVLKGVTYFRELIAKFQALTPEQKKWIMVIMGVVAVIGPLLLIVGSLVTAISALIPVITFVAGLFSVPLILIIAAVIAILALLWAAWQNNWGGIREITAAAIQFVSDIIDGGMKFINDLTTGQLGEWSDIWDRTTNAVKEIFSLWVANIKLVFAAFRAAFSGDWRRFGEILRQIWDNNWKIIVTIVKTAWANVRSAIREAINGLQNWMGSIDFGQIGTNMIASIADAIVNAGPMLLQAGANIFGALGDFLAGFFGGGGSSSGGGPFNGGNKEATGTGGRFVSVPSGFPGDTFPVMMSSGEKYMVAKKGEKPSVEGGSGTVNNYHPQITIYSGKADSGKFVRGLT